MGDSLMRAAGAEFRPSRGHASANLGAFLTEDEPASLRGAPESRRGPPGHLLVDEVLDAQPRAALGAHGHRFPGGPVLGIDVALHSDLRAGVCQAAVLTPPRAV